MDDLSLVNIVQYIHNILVVFYRADMDICN